MGLAAIIVLAHCPSPQRRKRGANVVTLLGQTEEGGKQKSRKKTYCRKQRVWDSTSTAPW